MNILIRSVRYISLLSLQFVLELSFHGHSRFTPSVASCLLALSQLLSLNCQVLQYLTYNQLLHELAHCIEGHYSIEYLPVEGHLLGMYKLGMQPGWMWLQLALTRLLDRWSASINCPPHISAACVSTNQDSSSL